MNSLKDCFKLNNGYKIPCIGLGTYKATNEAAVDVIKNALNIGYRHIDTAFFYDNEKEVGKAILESGINREEIFVTSKLWNDSRSYEKAKIAFSKTMKNLNLDYLDLYLIHWPANKKSFGEEAPKINAETWKALEELYLDGKIKAIGLSNFLPHHIEDLLKTAKIKPMVNQIEIHPGWNQTDVIEYCKKQDIVVEAWSPLGRKDCFENEDIKNIAKKYNKTPAQICIRWCLQHGVLPLPKTVNVERMKENADVFDFNIAAEDMTKIDNVKIDAKNVMCALPDEIQF